MIFSPPQSATNTVCGPAGFAVEARGEGVLTYRWRLDGVPLEETEVFTGTRGPVLTINRVWHEHAGRYDVVVRAGGAVTSAVARLTVEPGAAWALRATHGPASRFGHGMAFDSARAVTVMFGGRTNAADGGMIPLNDVWEWDGAAWAQRLDHIRTRGWTNIAGLGWRVTHRERPVARAHHAVCFDEARGRLVVFGGETRAPDGAQLFLNDLWEWDGTQWLFRATNGPAPRFFGSMAYDFRRGRAILYGGWPVPGPGEAADQDVVWEWDGEHWLRQEPAVRPDASAFLIGGKMVYDGFRRMAVFGPAGNDFWGWDGTNWIRLPGPASAGNFAPADGGFAYHANWRRGVWFGGQTGAIEDQTRSFDGEWLVLNGGALRPAARIHPAMAYDSVRQVMVLFGGDLTGARNSPGTNDTWELASPDRPVIATQPASLYRRAGESAVFSVRAEGRGLLSYRWYRAREGQPAELLPQISDTFTLSSVRPEDAGEYTVVVSSACGSTASRPAVLTTDPRLQIFRFGDRASLVWLPENRLLLEAADRTEGPWWIIPNPAIPFEAGMTEPARFFRLRRLP